MQVLQVLAREMAVSKVWCGCTCHMGSGKREERDEHIDERCPRCGGEEGRPEQIPDVRFGVFICNHGVGWLDKGVKKGEKVCSGCQEVVPALGPGYVATLENVMKAAGHFGVAHRVAKAAADKATSDPTEAAMRQLHKEWREGRWRPKTLYEQYTGVSPLIYEDVPEKSYVERHPAPQRSDLGL